MENHHHEEPKPTNKWLATPVIMAIICIAIVVGFISMSARTGCDGKCEESKTKEHGTEQHDGTHEEDHGTVTNNEEATDSTKATGDSTAVDEGHEEHDAHGH